MAKCFSKKYGNKGSAFNYPVPANFFQLKNAFQRLTYITASANNYNAFSGKDPAKGVFSIMHSYFESQCKYLFFTKYLTSTNMPTAQQKKGHKKTIGPSLPR